MLSFPALASFTAPAAWRLAAMALLGLSVACSHTASRVSDRQAESLGLDRSVISANGFTLVTYTNRATAGQTLHIYLEGDGTPWKHTYWVASDPGPNRPLMLHLMALDSAPGLYLGRPCYHGFASEAACDSRLWTSGRFSPTVIDAMAAAIDTLVRAGGYQHIVLFGHSGGATIAMLLAERLDGVEAVVTLAGVLDHSAWTLYHAYSPLSDSLNPARRPPLPGDIRQLHLAADEDLVVPPALSRAAVERQPGAELRVIRGYDHFCCWQKIWPAVLAEIDAW